MKKLICGLAAAAICISTAIGVSAEGETSKIKFGVANKITDSGYEVTVHMISDFACAGVEGSVMSLMSYNGSNLSEEIAAKNDAVSSIKANPSGMIKFSLLGDVKNGTVGCWNEFSFKERDTVADSSCVAVDIKSVEINSSGVNKSTASEVFVYGDANADNKIDIRDLINVKKRLAKIEVPGNEAAADCSGDGDVTTDDLVLLCKFLIGVKGTSLGK